MNFGSATQYLFSLESRGIKLDLDRMRGALAALGHPERSFPSILVAGTNGKGSTSTLLASVLERGGRRVGLYTSPHLLDYRERVRVNGRMIAPEAVTERVERDRETWERFELSFFEATTALAFAHFRDVRIDLAVLEVGMGGRLDATNTVEPILSVVTALGMDHAQILGDTAAKIAREKAGIFRPGVKAVAGSGPPGALDALRKRAAELGTPLHRRHDWLRVSEVERRAEGGARFRATARREGLGLPAEGIELVTPLAGRHQVANAALALLSLSLLANDGSLPVSPRVALDEVREGFARVRWPGRLEPPRQDLPLLADAAHNREGARVVADALGLLSREREVHLVAGMVEGKDHAGFFRELSRVARRASIGPLATPRSATPASLRALAERSGFECEEHATIAEALQSALASAQRSGALVLLAGSFFTLEEGYRALGIGPMECLWSA